MTGRGQLGAGGARDQVHGCGLEQTRCCVIGCIASVEQTSACEGVWSKVKQSKVRAWVRG